MVLGGALGFAIVWGGGLGFAIVGEGLGYTIPYTITGR